MAGQGRRPAVPGLNELIGADVELRCVAAQIYRGVLRAADADYLTIERSSDGRVVLVSRAAVVAILDELAPGLRAIGRRAAEDAEDREAE
jgi:hypothetical protein